MNKPFIFTVKPNEYMGQIEESLEPSDSDFFIHSHAFDSYGGGEHTLCGLAFEEFAEDKKVKKITCPYCIKHIEAIKVFKKGRDY